MKKVRLTDILLESVSVVVLAVIVWASFMDGRFGRKTLRKPYRNIWRFVCWTVFMYVVFTFVCTPFFRWWSEIVALLNDLLRP